MAPTQGLWITFAKISKNYGNRQIISIISNRYVLWITSLVGVDNFLRKEEYTTNLINYDSLAPVAKLAPSFEVGSGVFGNSSPSPK